MKAIVLGSGVDALVAAHVLARSGHEVLVIDEGAAAESGQGWVPPRVVRTLALDLKVETPDPWARLALQDGGTLELSRDMGRTVAALRRLSERDAAKWPEFCRRMAHIARLFETLYAMPADLPTSTGMALKVRRLGRQGMEDLMRVLPMSVAELLDDWFECDALKGALAAMGILHLQQGPRSGGTAFRLLHHHVGSAEGVFRPPRSNLASLLRQRSGVAIRRGNIAKILLVQGRARGVVLAGGEELDAQLIVSGIDPRRTLLDLADPGGLDPELARAISNVRRNGVVARLSFKQPFAGNFVLAPSLDYLERAYDESKYGSVSRAPYLETHGSHVHFQYAPYRLADGEWDDARRRELAELTRRLLPVSAGGEVEVMAPPDLEAHLGWPHGQAYHVELALDQALWMRPLPELARYRTPIEGLWLCGPGTYPGGGIAGASGYNCAREIVRNT